jgi:hypothetical protein
VLERRQQRAPDEVLGAEQVLFGERLAAGLREPDREQLAGVVPLIQRLGGVDPLVALQADERGVERHRQ